MFINQVTMFWGFPLTSVLSRLYTRPKGTDTDLLSLLPVMSQMAISSYACSPSPSIRSSQYAHSCGGRTASVASAASPSPSTPERVSEEFLPSQHASPEFPPTPVAMEFPLSMGLLPPPVAMEFIPSPRAISLAHAELVDAAPATDQHALPSIHRSEDFFLEDASLVLVSNENVAFAVHRSILRRHSTVLHDIFEIRTKAPESDMFEGLPFVRLDDSTEIIKTFFQIMYDQKPIESIKLPHRLLAFCDKYAFDSIVKKILAILSQTFPDTLKAWNRPRDNEQIKEVINVAIAASRLGMKIFIPSCLYTIMSSSIYERDLHKLPQALLLQYHHGFAHFSTYAINFYETTLKGRSTPPRGCHKKARCRDAWSDLRSSVEQTFLHDSAYIRYPKPLEFLQRLSDMVVSKPTYENYCTKCQVSLSDVLGDAQRDVWNSLPRIFKVADSWEELRQKDA